MIHCEYLVEGDLAVIYDFDRDNEGKKVLKKIYDFEPYFYVLEDEKYKIQNSPLVKKIEVCYTRTIDGKNVVKVITKLPKYVSELRDNVSVSFEGDILFPTRYTIDNFRDEIPKSKLRVCFLDIETNSDTFPSVTLADHEITAISCLDSLSNKLFTFCWHPNFKTETESKKFKDFDWWIVKCSNERMMMSKFLKFISDIDPDLITGWNVLDFDIRYIMNRLNNLGLEFTKLSSMGIAYNSEKDVVIKGRIIFDMWTAYKKFSTSDYPSYKLDYIASKELGENKDDIHPGQHGTVWRNTPERLIEYNAKDTYLVYAIDRKKSIIEFYDEIRRISKCSFNDVFQNSKIVDCALLSYTNGRYVLPTKTKSEETQIAGAEVLVPKSGIHDWCCVFDLEALYPSIIISGNMSQETITIHDIANPVIVVDAERNINTKFRQDKVGFLPEVLLYFLKVRKEVQKERDTHPVSSEEYKKLEMKQYALKIISNSFYGVLSYSGFRLYRPEIGECITSVGRQIILWNKKILEDKGYNVIYGDTDSIFLTIPNAKNLDDSLTAGKSMQETLNKSFDEFAKKFNMNHHRFHIAFEKVFRKILLGTSKKRYAGNLVWRKGKFIPVGDEDEITIVGFEAKRTDSSELGQEVQKKVFEMLLKLDSNKNEVINYLLSVKKDICNDKFSYEKIGLPTPLKKKITEYETNIPAVRSVVYSNKYLKLDIRTGEKFYIIYVKSVPGLPTTDVIAFRSNKDVPEGVILDYDKHIEESISSKCERVFGAINWSLGDLSGQKSISQW